MPGKIVHIEFPSADSDRAQGFWNGLFGWSFGDSGMPEMDYRMADLGDGVGAAIYSAESQPPGHAFYYYDTDDINASIARIRELGGKADDRQPVPGHGWFAVCADTEGNDFRLWQQDSGAA